MVIYSVQPPFYWVRWESWASYQIYKKGGGGGGGGPGFWGGVGGKEGGDFFEGVGVCSFYIKNKLKWEILTKTLV